jgi:hypothetical protein
VVAGEVGEAAWLATGQVAHRVGGLRRRVLPAHPEHADDVLRHPVRHARLEQPVPCHGVGTSTYRTVRPATSDRQAATSWKVIASGPVST